MLLHIPAVLSADDVRALRERLEQATWVDGRATVGPQGAQVKRNRQLRADDPLAVELGERVRQAVLGHPLFFAAALPLRVLPPLFNRYEGGGAYGLHVDGAVMRQHGSDTPLRSHAWSRSEVVNGNCCSTTYSATRYRMTCSGAFRWS